MQMKMGVRKRYKIFLLVVLAGIVVFFVVPIDWIIIPFLLFIPINLFGFIFLRCPNCKLYALSQRARFFGTETWIYVPWLNKRCGRCQQEFK